MESPIYFHVVIFSGHSLKITTRKFESNKCIGVSKEPVGKVILCDSYLVDLICVVLLLGLVGGGTLIWV